MTNIRIKIVFAFGLLLVMLTGCGFHLRGAVPGINQQPVMIVNSTPYTEINDALARQLKFAGFRLITPPRSEKNNGLDFGFAQLPSAEEIALPPSTYVLRIIDVRPTRLRLSGQYSEVRIGLTVTYRLDALDPALPAIVPDSRMEAFRNYQFDLLSINSESQQEAVYRIDLLKDVASQLVEQLVFQLRAREKTAA